MSRIKDAYQEVRGLIGRTVKGVSISIDLVDKCCLACPSCGAGVYRNSRGASTMSMDDFQKILDKVEKVWAIRYLMFFNHSDPCLHPELDKAITICRDRGIDTCVGTVLQVVKCDLEKVIEARPSEFRIGFSGWTHYGRNQKGARIERLNENMAILDKLPRHPETRYTVFWHSYNDNWFEREAVKIWCQEHRFEFIQIPAIFQALEKIVEKTYSEQDLEIISHMWETPEQMLSRVKKSNYCPLIRKWLTFDAKGNVFLCNNLYPDRFIVGNIWNDSVEQIQEVMENHPFCKSCKSLGVNQMHACYTNPISDEKPVLTGYNRFKYKNPYNT